MLTNEQKQLVINTARKMSYRLGITFVDALNRVLTTTLVTILNPLPEFFSAEDWANYYGHEKCGNYWKNANNDLVSPMVISNTYDNGTCFPTYK